MAALSDEVEQPSNADKVAQSASCFPRSFALIDRNHSNASSYTTDISDAAQSLTSEQQESLNSVSEAEELSSDAENALGSGQAVNRASLLDSAIHANGIPDGTAAPSQDDPQTAQQDDETSTPRLPNGVHPAILEDAASVLSTTAVDGSASSAVSAEAGRRGSKEVALGVADDQSSLPDSSKAATRQLAPRSQSTSSIATDEAVGERVPNGTENGCLALPTVESDGSGSVLTADSEPFVPSAPSSQQATPRDGSQSQQAAVDGGSARLNVNAAAFVPSSGARTPSDESSGTPWRPPVLQFGSLPESLTTSPHLSVGDQPGYDSAEHDAYSYHGGAGYGEGGNWQEYNGDGYGYDPHYECSTYTNADGCHYYQQADGTWVHWEPHSAENGHWQTGYEDGYQNGYEAYGSDGFHDGGQPRSARRPTKLGKRGSEKRRDAWHSATLDILESQFAYSRESLQEMLELHEGNLEVLLDMLAQLEAEADGQLPASGQDAPELNEENFPSLSSSTAASPRPASSKGGFAAAVKSPAPTLGEAGPGKKQRAGDGGPLRANGEASNRAEVSWKETGSVVSETYSNARAVARDHARLRNTYFQEATKAYLSGNRGLAKELSFKGREQSELMKAAHVEASQAIYRHRNPTAGRKGKPPALIDLHGLHVKEALAILEGELANVRRARPKGFRGAPQRLSVLVGLGKHTKGSKTPARLPAAVEQWLQASQITFTCSAPGLLELTL